MERNDCAIVRDLIPMYGEDLLSDETRDYMRDHMEHCGECRKYLEQCLREVQVPVEPPAQETDKKIIRGMRFRLIWYLFWPSLYAVCMQFGKEGTLRFFGIALILTAWITIGTHHYEYNFDLDDTKREFYQREEKSIREHKGTFLTQGLLLCLPVFIPFAIGVAGMLLGG